MGLTFGHRHGNHGSPIIPSTIASRGLPFATMSTDQDARLDFPATHRNGEPIFGVLSRVMPREGLVLEIGSGSGQHVVRFAKGLPKLRFQPTDPDPDHVASIDAWRAHEEADNVLPALHLDATKLPWPLERADAIYCANVIHISPWEVALSILEGASRVLPPEGLLFFYGPFMRGGAHTAPSNERFDESLRSRDPRWGVRDLTEVSDAARDVGLHRREVVDMPANNLSVIFRKDARGS
jgi:SAM-dependent methyltransferase